jgi:O-antigen/teichoic acid export membrane protein
MGLRLQALRGRAATTVADQAFSSASNFLVGLVIARLAGPGAFGAFALAYAVWLLAGGIHRALIVNPMMIVAPAARQGTWPLEQALAAELLLSLSVASMLALSGALLWVVGSSTLGWVLVALAPWLPVLLVQDLWRWVGFMRGQPARSLVNDIAFTVTQVGLVAAFGLGGHLTLGTIIAAWGGGAAVGAAIGLWQFGVRPRPTGGWRFLQRSWPDGRWLFVDFITSYGSSQSWQYLVAAMFGPAAFGLVRAAFNLMGPTNVFLLGGSGYGLPTSVEALHSEGGKRLDAVVARVTILIALGTAAYVLPVILGRGLLVEAVYGEQYRQIGTLVVLAGLTTICTGLGFGAGIGLTAARRTRTLFMVRMTSAAMSVTCLRVTGRWLGVVGAGWASLAGTLAYVVLIWGAYLAYRRAEAAGGAARHHSGGPSSEVDGGRSAIAVRRS